MIYFYFKVYLIFMKERLCANTSLVESVSKGKKQTISGVMKELLAIKDKVNA